MKMTDPEEDKTTLSVVDDWSIGWWIFGVVVMVLVGTLTKKKTGASAPVFRVEITVVSTTS